MQSSNTSEGSEASTTQQLRTMHVTISTSLENPKTPVVPKFLCPSTFDLFSGNAVAFMKKLGRTAAANSWDNHLKFTYPSTFLEEASELWFNGSKIKEKLGKTLKKIL